MLMPVVAYFLVYAYFPMIRGLQTSFQNVRLNGERTYVGFANYNMVLHDPNFLEAIRNTFIIGGGILIFNFVVPLIIALSLNEILHSWFKKLTQIVLYIPHLLSWSVVGGIWIFILSPDNGLVNLLIMKLTHSAPVHFLADGTLARGVMIFMATWKDMGYNCILFLAGIVTINPSLYEAARMDGASRWQQLIYVTLPQLSNTMKVIFMLNTLGSLRILDQVLILQNPAIARKVDVLMMYTFQKGIMEIKLGPAAAASFYVVLLTLAMAFIVRRITRFDEV